MDCYWSLFNSHDQSRFDGLRTAHARSIVGSIPKDQVVHWLAWKEGTAEWAALSTFGELFSTESSETASSVLLADTDALLGPGLTNPVGNTNVTNANLTNSSIEDPNFEFSAESEFNTGMSDDDDEEIEEKEPTRTNTKSFQNLDLRRMPEVTNAPQNKIKPKEFNPNVARVIEFEEVVLEIDAGDDASLKVDKRKSTRYRRRVSAEVEIGDKVMRAKTIDLSLGGCQLDLPLPESLTKKHVRMRLIKGKDKIEAYCQIVFDITGKPTNRFRFLDVDRIDLLRTWLVSP